MNKLLCTNFATSCESVIILKQIVKNADLVRISSLCHLKSQGSRPTPIKSSQKKKKKKKLSKVPCPPLGHCPQLEDWGIMGVLRTSQLSFSSPFLFPLHQELLLNKLEQVREKQ